MSDFWSRRRAAVEAEQSAEEAALKQEARAELEATYSETGDAELLEELGLPDPDALGEGDDFKQFLTDVVPARLKTRALRRLWRVNPVLANLDGLLDYGEDFTDSALVVENLQTAYQVGKGMLKHVEEMARKADQADDETVTEGTPEPLAENAAQAPETVHAAAPEQDVSAEPIEMLTDAAPIMPNRRMQFTFEDTPPA